MSFVAREVARWLGQPVELYRFTRQTLHWRYTSAETAITVGGETFQPIAISRSKIVESVERRKRELTITLPVEAAVCANWVPLPPADTVAVALLAWHRGETDTAALWTGRVVQPRFTDTSVELTCQLGLGSVRPRGLQLRWQRGCPLVLYGQGLGMCNLNPASFAEPAVLDSASGATLSAAVWAALPAGRLAGGYVQWTAADGLVHRRTVTAHVGADVTLDYGSTGLSAGDAVTAYHGCAHDYADCASKFNGHNFGGCTNLPAKDVFSGVPIWW